MKKDIFTKSLIGVSTASIISASCSNETAWMEDIVDSSEPEVLFPDEGTPVINIKLSIEETNYLNFLNGLATDIIKEPAVAREFARDPSTFVKQYGYKDKVNLDEGMLRLILTLGDEDINNAISQKDVTKAIELMKSKGLLDDICNSKMKIQFSQEEISKIYKQMGANFEKESFDEKISISTAVAVTVLYVLAAAIESVAVGYSVAGAFNLAAYFTVVVYSKTSLWPRLENYMDGTIHRNLPLKIWSLKGQKAKTYMAADKYVTDQAKKMMKLIKDYDPEILQKIDERYLEQILKVSLSNSSTKELY